MRKIEVATHYSARLARTDRSRNALLSAFGQDAVRQPAFAQLFYPLQREFPFLSSEKQLAVQRIFADHGVNDIRAEIGGFGCANCEKIGRQIRRALTKEEYLEYNLRASPLARQLANSGFDFTESEFREVYRILDVQGDGNDTTVLAAARGSRRSLSARIAEVLGPERFERYTRVQDPLYKRMLASARRYGVGVDAVDVGFDLITKVEKSTQSISRVDEGANHSMATAQMYADRDRQLTSVLGTEVMAEIGPILKARERRGTAQSDSFSFMGSLAAPQWRESAPTR